MALVVRPKLAKLHKLPKTRENKIVIIPYKVERILQIFI
jgi:hypothetical protein